MPLRKQELEEFNFCTTPVLLLARCCYSSILRLEEAGTFLKWKKKHFPVDRCALERSAEGPQSRSISLSDVYVAFILLCVGAGAAGVVFLVELSCRRRPPRPRPRPPGRSAVCSDSVIAFLVHLRKTGTGTRSTQLTRSRSVGDLQLGCDNASGVQSGPSFQFESGILETQPSEPVHMTAVEQKDQSFFTWT